MTTLIVDIEKADDLAAVKNLFKERGLNYEVGEDLHEDFVYTDEIKKMLDEREEEYLSGKVTPISAEESKERIKQLLASFKK